MTDNQLRNVLDQLITLTNERESNTAENVLIHSLSSLAHISHFAMYSKTNIARIKHAIASNTPLDKEEMTIQPMIEALDHCLITLEIMTETHAGKTRTLFPLNDINKHPLAVIVIESDVAHADHHLAIQLLKIYDNFASIILDNERDALTGLLNRKTFDLKVNKIITSLHNSDTSTSKNNTFLAIFDIDHFKHINDSHGHLIGDEVLILFSQVMEKNFRGKDLLFRFGGEEFVNVCCCPNEATMFEVLDRFRTVIEDYRFPQIGHITVSCGFTKINPSDLAPNIIGRADKALYHAKHSGRNQVHQYETLVAQGVLHQADDTGGEVELF